MNKRFKAFMAYIRKISCLLGRKSGDSAARGQGDKYIPHSRDQRALTYNAFYWSHNASMIK